MGKSYPIVSVVIPTYNRANVVGRAIRSVQAQTFEDWKLIVVDDASTDNTEEVVSSFADSRVRYYRHQANRGGSVARNTGIQRARGEYIAFLDSDDEWLPNKLEKQVQVFENSKPTTGLVFTGMVHLFCDSQRVSIPPKHRGDLTRNLLIRNVVGSSSTSIVRKNVFDQVGGFDERLPARQDIDMWLRISKQYSIDYAEGCLAVIHKEGRDRLSGDDWGRCKGYIGFYNKHKALLAAENLLHVYLCRMGRAFDVRSDKAEVARMCYLRSLKEAPTYMSSYFLLAAIYLPDELKELLPESLHRLILGRKRRHKVKDAN